MAVWRYEMSLLVSCFQHEKRNFGWLSLKQGTGNRGTGNGERVTWNGERGMGNGEWGTGNL